MPDKIDEPVGQVEVDRHFRVLGQESIEDRNEVAPAEIDRRTQSDRAGYPVHAKTNKRLQLVGFGQEAPGALDQQSPLVGQADGPGRAQQERCSEISFQRR